jgi:hypothetical protein
MDFCCAEHERLVRMFIEPRTERTNLILRGGNAMEIESRIRELDKLEDKRRRAMIDHKIEHQMKN